MKRTAFWIMCIATLFALGVGIYLAWFYWIRPVQFQDSTVQVQDFSLKDYSYELSAFSSDTVLGPVDNASSAQKKAYTALVDVFGEEKISNQKPLVTCYDKDSNAWLVYGSLPPLTLGGTAHIIINAEDGAVLAVWHTK